MILDSVSICWRMTAYGNFLALMVQGSQKNTGMQAKLGGCAMSHDPGLVPARLPSHPGNYPHCRIINLVDECRRDDNLYGTVNYCYLSFDIRGYTKVFKNEVNRREVINFMRELFGKSCSVITTHSGRVNKLIGDALFAIFPSAVDGASRNQNEAVANAVNYAFFVLKTFHNLIRTKSEIYQNILGPNGIEGLGFGVSTGNTYLGMMGGTLQDYTDFSYFGEPINLLFRLSGKAHSAQILVPKDMIDTYGGTIVNCHLIVPMGAIPLKHFKDSVETIWIIRPLTEVELENKENFLCCDRCASSGDCRNAAAHGGKYQLDHNSEAPEKGRGEILADKVKELRGNVAGSAQFGVEYAFLWKAHHQSRERPCCPACTVAQDGNCPNLAPQYCFAMPPKNGMIHDGDAVPGLYDLMRETP